MVGVGRSGFYPAAEPTNMPALNPYRHRVFRSLHLVGAARPCRARNFFENV